MMRNCLIIIFLVLTVSSAFALPNFKEYSAGQERHTAFFNYLRPLVEQVNQKILVDRKHLLRLYHKKFIKHEDLSKHELDWVTHLFYRYKIAMSDQQQQWHDLLMRVDIVPTSLVLAQAANETAYGITRFAQHGNNFFGMWCYEKDCGIVPLDRAADKTHQVKKYSSVTASISDYIDLLNTKKQYIIFRELRAQERSFGKEPSGMILASGLLSYSQMREQYVEALQKIIIQNQLEPTIDYNANN